MFKILNAQYQGYLKTPNLWYGNVIYNLEQLDMSIDGLESFDLPLPKNIRLGKRVEHFVFYELKQHPDVSVLAENIQIQQDKLTLGELDALLLFGDTPIHLEIIYKFYVYDASVGETELDHWIGPNRKDSLVAKLKKLKNKQLPLLYHSETQKFLKKHDLEVEKIEQKVLFKAQLFVPYRSKKTDYGLINKACIRGYYLKPEELQLFKDCKFYIPTKANWLVTAYTNVNWLVYVDFIAAVTTILDWQTAPLVWIKHPNGEMETCFIVWW